MIEGKWYPQGSDLSTLLPVRQAVFGRGADALDQESWNVLVWQDSVPAATGRLWWRDGAFHIGDIGVVPSLRGQRIGDLTLRLLLFKAQSHFAREVRLRCARDLCGFFARLGFEETAGDSAQAAGEEVEMLLPGDKILLDGCAACKKENCPSRT